MQLWATWFLIGATGCAASTAHGSHAKPSAHASPISPDPGAVPQVCRVRHGDGAWVTLRMTLLARPHLGRECQRVADYLALPPGPLPPVVVGQAEEALAKLGYFGQIGCNLVDGVELACALTPIPVVRSYGIVGHLPVALLQEDIRRRVSLRPGTLMADMPAALHAQSMRLENYLRGEGYFESAVAIVPRRVAGTGLNQDTHLDIGIAVGHTAMVRHIRFEGDARVPEELLAKPFWQRGVFGLPQRFRPAALAENVATATAILRDRGYFGAHVQASWAHYPEAHAIDLTVRVRAGRQVQLKFVGNTAVSERALRRLAPFAASGAVDSVAVEQLRQSIVRLYQDKGFAEVDVQSTLGRGASQAVEVTYVIDAGRRYRVTQLVYHNLHRLDPEALLAAGELRQRASSRFRTRPWVDAYVAHDQALLTGMLRAQGLAQAHVVVRKQPGAAPRTLVVHFDVDEGQGLQVESLTLTGLPADVDVNALTARLKLQAGRPLAAGGVDNDVSEIESALAQMGYIGADVAVQLGHPLSPEAAPGEQALREALAAADETPPVVPVAVSYVIDAGPQARLGGIFIHGNFRTRSRTLLQEVGVRAGEPLNLAALGAARRTLRGLNLFNAVQLTPAQSSLGNHQTWLVLALEERHVRSIEAVAAYSSNYRFSLGADLRDANVLGRAIMLTLQARLANASRVLWHPLRIGDEDLIDALVRAPHPFGLPLTAEAGAMYRFRDTEVYQERRLSGQAALSKPLLSRGSCAWCPDVMGRLGYELTNAYYANRHRSGMMQRSDAPEQTITRIIPKLTLSRRDSAIDPRKGAAGDVTLEVANPIFAGNLGASASAFWRVLTSAQAFMPLGTPLQVEVGRHHMLGGPLVLAISGSFNYAGIYGPRGGVPPSETFGYGGDLSVRGIANRASTLQLPEATSMVTASAELRWYVVENLGFGSVQLTGFVDSGSVATSPKSLYRAHTLSVGPAVRYVTPIGPVSLAYGWALVVPRQIRERDVDAAPSRGRLHFTFGYTF